MQDKILTLWHIYTLTVSVSYFSLAFRQALEASKKSQTDLAAIIDVSVAQVNRYARGRSDLRGDVLVKILAAFSDDIAANLLRAYLLDQCPPDKQHLVDIAAAVGMVQEPGPDGLDHLPEDAKIALRYIGARCSEQVVLDFVLDFARLLRGEAAAELPAITPVDQIADDSRTRRAQQTRASHKQKA